MRVEHTQIVIAIKIRSVLQNMLKKQTQEKRAWDMNLRLLLGIYMKEPLKMGNSFPL